jgi:hypothetical protein
MWHYVVWFLLAEPPNVALIFGERAVFQKSNLRSIFAQASL